MKIHQTELEVVRGSVLDQEVDAIVNSASTAMRGGGTLNAAIHRAAGREMLTELKEVAPHGAHTAQVVVTSGHKLPQKFVFHVVGPVWTDETLTAQWLLGDCYRNALEEAQKRGLESLALPALSTGVNSFPLYLAAFTATYSAVDFLTHNPETSLRRVIFSMYGGAEHFHFQKAIEEFQKLVEKYASYS